MKFNFELSRWFVNVIIWRFIASEMDPVRFSFMFGAVRHDGKRWGVHWSGGNYGSLMWSIGKSSWRFSGPVQKLS